MALAEERANPLFGHWALMSTEIIGDLTRLAGVLSLLAAHNIGCGGGWTRARQRLAQSMLRLPHRGYASRGRGYLSTQGPAKGMQRYGPRLRFGVAGLWMTLLLSIVAYAVIRGEAGLADLEAMGVAVTTD